MRALCCPFLLRARWGMSLSDAVNTFLIKSVEVGGLPFDMRPEPKPVYRASAVLPGDPAELGDH